MKWKKWSGLLLFGFLISCEKSQKSSSEEDENPINAPVKYLGTVHQAQVSSQNRLAIFSIQKAIEQFQITENRLPKGLDELSSSGFLPTLPKVSKGFSLAYEARNGKVSLIKNPARE